MGCRIEIGLAAVEPQFGVAITEGVAQFPAEMLPYVFTHHCTRRKARAESGVRCTSCIANGRVVVRTKPSRSADRPGLCKTQRTADRHCHEREAYPHLVSHISLILFPEGSRGR